MFTSASDRAFAVTVYRHANTTLNLKRAKRWLPAITAILKKNNIPEDFKYLPVIESNLLNLISPQGATGFWQFMPETARQYGLEITSEVDERYHPIKSTEAAVQYFRDAYRIFNNWTCVAASYNMGMQGLKTKIEAQNTQNYYDLYLNAETSAYLFFALATKCVFEHPEKYGYAAAAQKQYPKVTFRQLEVTQSIPSLINFARSQQVSYLTLKEYNPWLQSNSLTLYRPNQRYVLLLPQKEKKMTEG
ncbi:MAG: lytic transglycosylase domain-containing protein [Bacteroidia bacterium]|nr:lytic transglycosylase domain-containing protein [Bacteroidia bacterium]